jgi:molybdopterin/thiamine biosynthesis adenylyltransferase
MHKYDHLTRQLDLISPDVLGEPIHIIGAGAIGGATAMALAKMGFEDITVYDFDSVEVENISNQWFRFSDIGRPKVEALKEIIKDFTGVEIDAKAERYESGALKGIVISAVDSMAARKMIWDAHKDFGVGTKLFIDGRMAVETALIYAMQPMNDKDVASYEKTLYTDENAVHERCTAKAVMYTTMAIAGHIAKIVKDFLCNEDQNYARVCEWSLAHNQQKVFMKNGMK